MASTTSKYKLNIFSGEEIPDFEKINDTTNKIESALVAHDSSLKEKANKSDIKKIEKVGNSITISNSNKTTCQEITLDSTGTYVLLGFITFSTNATGSRQLELQINENPANSVELVPNQVGYTSIQVLDILDLNIGDIVKLNVLQNSGLSLDCFFPKLELLRVK